MADHHQNNGPVLSDNCCFDKREEDSEKALAMKKFEKILNFISLATIIYAVIITYDHLH